MSADWYARKLGRQANPPSQQATPDTQPWLQRHSSPAMGSSPPQIPLQGLPADVLPTDENGQAHLGDAIVRWRGGEGTRTETQRCPVCVGRGRAGNKLFSLKSQSKISSSGTTATPAPRCFECGWTGIYTPYGGDLSQ